MIQVPHLHLLQHILMHPVLPRMDLRTNTNNTLFNVFHVFSENADAHCVIIIYVNPNMCMRTQCDDILSTVCTVKLTLQLQRSLASQLWVWGHAKLHQSLWNCSRAQYVQTPSTKYTQEAPMLSIPCVIQLEMSHCWPHTLTKHI